MKRSKKLLKGKKPVVIFIYGPVAVGKFTVGKVLSKKLGYKLVHNHHIGDFVDEIFVPHSYASNQMKEHLRYIVPESMVKAGINFVLNHCYRNDFISLTGLSDLKYVRTLEKKLIKLGVRFCPVHLKASGEELLRRVNIGSRRAFRKLKNKKIMREYLSTLNWHTSPKLRNNLVIDNTNLSPQKVSDLIIKHFKIKPLNRISQ